MFRMAIFFVELGSALLKHARFQTYFHFRSLSYGSRYPAHVRYQNKIPRRKQNKSARGENGTEELMKVVKEVRTQV